MSAVRSQNKSMLTSFRVTLQMQRTLILLLAGLVVASAQPFQPGQNLAPTGRALACFASMLPDPALTTPPPSSYKPTLPQPGIIGLGTLYSWSLFGRKLKDTGLWRPLQPVSTKCSGGRSQE